MNTYYSVICMIDDDSNIRLFLGDSIKAATIPNNSYKSTEFGDVWINWFSEKNDAIQYIEEQT